MQCPICGLINPETAQSCDCGYNFETRSDRNVSPKELEKILSERNKIRNAIYFAIKLILGVMGAATARWLYMRWHP